MKTFALALTILTTLAPAFAVAQSTQAVDPVPLDTTTQTAPGEPASAPPDAFAAAASTDPFVLFHLAGFADATYMKAQGADILGAFTLAPIFHLQFGERVLFEAELELEGDDRGASDAVVEYAAVNWLLNDHAALVVGRFLSPIGYFSANQHPSWINKMASVPAGFGHAGAAPASDFGVQLRGGKSFAGGQQINYAVYMANGPQLGLEGMEGLNLGNEGATRNPDGKRVAGGRLGWIPVPGLEVGLSRARGDMVLDPGAMGTGPEPSRRYQVDGVDIAWRPTKALDLRGEWIRQQVGRAPGSVVPDQATWRAWFVQGAFRFGSEKWEAVLRYGDSLSPHGESTFKQTAVGLNYLFRPNAKLKLTQEFNDSADAGANADRLLLQLAYGL